MQISPAVAGLVGHAKAGIEHIPPSTLLEPNPGLLSSRYPTQGLSGCVEPSGDAESSFEARRRERASLTGPSHDGLRASARSCGSACRLWGRRWRWRLRWPRGRRFRWPRRQHDNVPGCGSPRRSASPAAIEHRANILLRKMLLNSVARGGTGRNATVRRAEFRAHFQDLAGPGRTEQNGANRISSCGALSNF